MRSISGVSISLRQPPPLYTQVFLDTLPKKVGSCLEFYFFALLPQIRTSIIWMTSVSINLWRELRGQVKSYIGNKKRNAVIFFMIIMFLQLQGRILRKEKSSVKAWCLSENGWTTPSCWCCGIHLLMERLLFGHPYRIIFAKVRHIHIQLWCCCGQIY